MNELTLYGLYAAIFLGTLLLVEGVYYAFFADRAAQRAANRRMQLLQSGKSAKVVYETLRRPMPHGRPRFVEDPVAWLQAKLAQAGISWSVRQLALFVAFLSIIVFLLALWVGPGITAVTPLPAALGAGLLAVIGSVGGTILVIHHKRTDRLKRFRAQLPDALDIMVRSLRAGHPVATAMKLATQEMADPVGSEFGIAVDEMAYGLDLRDALTNLGDRIELPEYEYVVAAINTQYETGGNLAEILNSLSGVIRDRFRMVKKVRALSAEGKMSAIVLSALPPITVGFIMLTTPSYYAKVVDDPLFWPMIGGAVALLLLGIVVMWRMVNFRI